MSLDIFVNLIYIVASILFILGLKRMSKPSTARNANLMSAVGMLLAIVATCLTKGLEFHWIIIGILIGSAIGVWIALNVSMTAMPQMVGLLNGSGGLASFLVG